MPRAVAEALASVNQVALRKFRASPRIISAELSRPREAKFRLAKACLIQGVMSISILSGSSMLMETARDISVVWKPLRAQAAATAPKPSADGSRPLADVMREELKSLRLHAHRLHLVAPSPAAVSVKTSTSRRDLYMLHAKRSFTGLQPTLRLLCAAKPRKASAQCLGQKQRSLSSFTDAFHSCRATCMAIESSIRPVNLGSGQISSNRPRPRIATLSTIKDPPPANRADKASNTLVLWATTLAFGTTGLPILKRAESTS